MPLRDHFSPPLDERRSWDELHGGWPMVMVQHLARTLPVGYFAAPAVHLGTIFEVDIATYSDEHRDNGGQASSAGNHDDGDVATKTWAPSKPTLTFQPRLPDQDDYEIRVYDERKGRRLVAAIEIISPSNKDRPESRGALVSKVAALLRQGVCVSLVDVVSTRRFNLYSELLILLEGPSSTREVEPSPTYAATVRCRLEERALVLDAWHYPLQIGEVMPSLPVWLNEALSVALDLEATYEDTCRALRIT